MAIQKYSNTHTGLAGLGRAYPGRAPEGGEIGSVTPSLADVPGIRVHPKKPETPSHSNFNAVTASKP